MLDDMPKVVLYVFYNNEYGFLSPYTATVGYHLRDAR